MLPETYLSPQHLPFNAHGLQGHFSIGTPDGDPGGAGVWVLLRGSELLVSPVQESGEFPCGTCPAGEKRAEKALYIGSWRGQPCRTLSLSLQEDLPDRLEAHSLLAAEPQLAMERLSLGGLAGQILHWEKNSRHCSRCGSTLQRLAGTWGKRCPGCGAEHFPHIHPCVIVLVGRPGEILLARKANWPPNRYSLVAGFVDFGECLEEAASREVREETGIEVQNLRYLGSQSWPFPSQLMAGFVADYAGGTLRIDTTELEDARWFPLDQLPSLPPKRSIARYLIDGYAAGF